MKRIFFLAVLLCIGTVGLMALPLPIPPQVTSDSFSLTAQQGMHSFNPGDKPTATLGYNTDYLGPTLRLKQGKTYKVTLANKMDEPTTLHWHGLLVPSAIDGNMKQVIKSQQKINIDLPVKNEAGTYWYHPHTMDLTGNQAYRGLAGFIIVDDDNPLVADLPHEYGVDDLPIVVQDREIDSKGRLKIPRGGAMQAMMGIRGNTLTVNGTVEPDFKVTRSKLRLRLLNGSNDNVFTFSFTNDEPFALIATDGGYLERPVMMEKIVLSPGERREIIIDLSGLDLNKFKLGVTDRYDDQSTVLSFSGAVKETSKAIPARLHAAFPTAPANPKVDQEIALQMGGMMSSQPFRINGKSFDIDRIDLNAPAGKEQIWHLVNQDRSGGGMMHGVMPHSVHIHGAQFRVLSFNGAPPPADLAGLHDTIVLNPDDEAIIAVTFPLAGDYLVHCHFLSHEDVGMMVWLRAK